MGALVTAEEIAARLRLKPSTIKRWAQDGFVPTIKITGKVVRFDPEDVEQALRQRSLSRKGTAR